MRVPFAAYGLCLAWFCGFVRAEEKSLEQLLLQAEQLQRQGSFPEAETVLRTALAAAEKLPPKDIRLAVTLLNLGSVCQSLGRPATAGKFYERSLSAWERSLGADHPSLARPLSALLALSVENGFYAKAERLQRRYMTLRAPNDPESSRFLHSIAAVYHARRKYSQAEPLYRQALEEAGTGADPQGKEVALLLNNLGLLYAQTGQDPEATSHLERALAMWERELGSRHPNVIRGLVNLAAFHSSKRRHAEAEPLFRRALATAESVLGAQDPLMGKVLEEYAVLLRKTKRKAEAAPLEKRAKAIRDSHSHETLGRHTIGIADLLPPESRR
jgi:tetratricopeptide (TPR) repeat protein